jgi:polyhydroxyalkanoate synthesis regulator phasin
MALFKTLQKALMAGLGMQEKVKEFIEELVKKGELSKTQGAKLIKEWSKKAGKTKEEFDKNITDLVKKALEKINIPTRSDIEELNKKVKSLSARVKKLEKSKKGR